MIEHEALVEEATAAINRVHDDTDVSKEQTMESLGTLREHIEMLESALESDDGED